MFEKPEKTIYCSHKCEFKLAHIEKKKVLQGAIKNYVKKSPKTKRSLLRIITE